MSWFTVFYTAFVCVGLATPSLCFFQFQSIKNHALNIVGRETCSDYWTSFNLTHFDRALQAHLFGQHLVEQYLPKLVKSHRRSPSSKALAIALHGSTGTGKTFVTKLLAEHLLRRGEHSAFFHRFISYLHFPLSEESAVRRYKEQLRTWIRGNVSACGSSLFVFEEVDKFPEGLLNEILPFVEHYAHVDGIDYRNAMFVFTTNLGTKEIAKQVRQHYEERKSRVELTPGVFDSVLAKHSYQSDGGLKYSSLLKKHVIDLHLPFLLLERKHVKKCVEAEMKRFDSECKPTQGRVAAIANELDYYEFSEDSFVNGLFSMTGCKKVAAQVRIHC